MILSASLIDTEGMVTNPPYLPGMPALNVFIDEPKALILTLSHSFGSFNSIIMFFKPKNLLIGVCVTEIEPISENRNFDVLNNALTDHVLSPISTRKRKYRRENPKISKGKITTPKIESDIFAPPLEIILFRKYQKNKPKTNK